MTQHTSRIALVGDRSANVRAHARIPAIIDALLTREGIALDPYWIATPDVSECDLGGFDAIWVVPGSPYDSAEGALAAVRTAREQRIPFLGTCGGFQYALMEYARNVCGLRRTSRTRRSRRTPASTSSSRLSARSRATRRRS